MQTVLRNPARFTDEQSSMPTAASAYRSTAAALLVLAVAPLLAVPSAMAQGPIGSPREVARPAGGDRSVLQDIPLQKALDQSIATNKLLVVVVSPNADKAKKNAAVWNNPALASWISRHAIAAHVTDKDTIKRLIEWELLPTEPESPHVFRDGKKIRLFGGGVRGSATRLRNPPKDAKPWPANQPNASIRLVMKLEWTLRSAEKQDANWWERHEAAVMGEKRPIVELLAGASDTGVSAYVPKAGESTIAVVAKARELLAGSPANEALDQATGMLTWVYETSAGRAQRAILLAAAPLMAELAAKHEPARVRFAQLRVQQAASFGFMTRTERFNWLLLSRVLGEQLESLDFLDSALSDKDTVELMPTEDRLGWEVLLPRMNWADGLTLRDSLDAEAYLTQLDVKASKKPTTVSVVGFERLRDDVRSLRAFETARLHLNLLQAGREAEAMALLTRKGAGTDDVAAAIGLAAAAGLATPAHEKLCNGSVEKAWPGITAAVTVLGTK